MQTKEQKKLIREAVYLAGSQTRLADDLGISREYVSQWVRRDWPPNAKREAQLIAYVKAQLAKRRRELAKIGEVG